MNICFELQNGEELTARTEEWVAAIIATLSEGQKTAVFERVEKKLIGYSTPGSHLLHADPQTLIRARTRKGG
jgi:hypothetical protein